MQNRVLLKLQASVTGILKQPDRTIEENVASIMSALRTAVLDDHAMGVLARRRATGQPRRMSFAEFYKLGELELAEGRTITDGRYSEATIRNYASRFAAANDVKLSVARLPNGAGVEVFRWK